MTITYKDIKPWGRSLQEYIDMFKLTDQDLQLKILGCGDGPAGFNAEMHGKNLSTISADPIYKFSKNQIESKIQETSHDILEQTRNNKDKFIWTSIKSPEELAKIRLKSMKLFLEDFECGKKENRYIDAELPILPFKDSQFDLALCSHFLFLYSENLSLEFHINSIKEMLRVAGEVRIFPTLDCNSNTSKHLSSIKKYFNSFKVQITKVNYEFQKNGNQMLSISS